MHKILLTTKRNDILDCCYYGSVFLANKNAIYKSFGCNCDSITFMRSLAKPLQASIMADCDIVRDFKLSKKEIAIFCASHSGSPSHVKLLERLVKRFNIKKSDILLQAQYPLDMRNFKGRKTKLQNNCSAKHIMMILMSKYLGFDIKDYLNPNGRLQKLIQKKQFELSGFNSDILTYDGCASPLWGLSYKNIIDSYFNLFHTKKYDFIFDSILKNPYLFGGFDRLDTEIITLSNKKLFSKVGAGGFVIVYNFEKDEILLLKLAQNNNDIRKYILFDILNKLSWLKVDAKKYDFNQHNQKVAKYCYEFNL